MNYNPNCGRCGMLNHWGQCQLTACRFPVQESGVINGSAYVAKIVTNADRIRQMTDEELAEMFDEYGKRNDVCPKFGAYSCHDENCYDCWLDWLKQEVTE